MTAVHLVYNPYDSDLGVRVFLKRFEGLKEEIFKEGFHEEDIQSEGVLYVAYGTPRLIAQMKTLPEMGTSVVVVVLDKFKLWVRRYPYHKHDLTLKIDQVKKDFPKRVREIEQYKLDKSGVLWGLYEKEDFPLSSPVITPMGVLIQLMTSNNRLLNLRVVEGVGGGSLFLLRLQFLTQEFLYFKSYSWLDQREGRTPYGRKFPKILHQVEASRVLALLRCFPSNSIEDLVLRFHLELECLL